MKQNTELDPKDIAMEEVVLEGESYFKIPDSDLLRPFFMSIVSDSNHWMFLSSNGGISAGRKDANHALFPYYTDDKITETAELTGSKSIFHISRAGQSRLWEPFSVRQQGLFNTTRNLYKNRYGNKVIFEEINHDLGVGFRYQWSSSNQYGFVRRATLTNRSDTPVHANLLDGIQNLVPFGVGSELQNRQSNLVDAYKRSEILETSGIGIYALSAIIVDKAEPSEALKANVAWSLGLDPDARLASSLQLDTFRGSGAVEPEYDVKAEKGAYFLQGKLELPPHAERSWMIVANVNQDQAAVAALARDIRKDNALEEKVLADVALGTQQLVALCAASDGLQTTGDSLKDTRHFSNTMFNIMRGGIFDRAYIIEKWDFQRYLRHASPEVYQNHAQTLEQLPGEFHLELLRETLAQAGDADLTRLGLEYLPLKFSRRHGDPSRPWNAFSINTRSEVDGSKILDYQGNWRDIFQNWEALAHSYPLFIEGMIFKFLNASTFDGYNPYRVTKDGFDWEVIEPDDPWSYIGYWGDHQVIYLLKFLEFAESHFPGRLQQYFDQPVFVYANVPYRIKPYAALLENPKDTIDFDAASDKNIEQLRERFGADGALLRTSDTSVYRVNFVEKILAMLLAKVSNFIPEGGIWLNTQRPEWNDANNALVGNGVSMVTLYYMRRFLAFFSDVLDNTTLSDIAISEELHTFFSGVETTLKDAEHLLSASFRPEDRRAVLDGLGMAGSQYREQIYAHSFSGARQTLSMARLRSWVALTRKYLEHSIRANKRRDNLYHAYNLMALEPSGGVSISYLSEMLEGQVAVLSSGYLEPTETLEVLDALKGSALFREDQYSYLLYPNKELPRFMEKNVVPQAEVDRIPWLKNLVAAGNRHLLVRDVDGNLHFNGNFRNAADLRAALAAISWEKGQEPSDQDRSALLELHEKVFNHKAFTGRSGTFFGYEGLGSIYWHMVSKLLLAAQECCIQALEKKADAEVTGRLLEHYYEINEGIGVHKSPGLYGAFPTDPYSHTPLGKGAQQPGMTGQVKEDILCRFGELGVHVHQGCIRFRPGLLRRDEFPEAPVSASFLNVEGEPVSLDLPSGSLGYTLCQVPVIYRIGESRNIRWEAADSGQHQVDGLSLDRETSTEIFGRTGKVRKLEVTLTAEDLR